MTDYVKGFSKINEQSPPYNLFILISDSQVSISSVKAMWQEWFCLNPDCFSQNKSLTRKCSMT